MQDDDPLAYFLTWTTYGTWLPGDSRGWVEYRGGIQLPDPSWKLECEARMTADACVLNQEQRALVERQIRETCRFKAWQLHALNCRSNHVHVVVTAPVHPKVVREQLKAWCTRRLKEHQRHRLLNNKQVRETWWTERGSTRWINQNGELETAVYYVNEAQDDQRRYTSNNQPDAKA